MRDGVFALLQLAMRDGRLGDETRGVVLDYVKDEAELRRWSFRRSNLLELWMDNLAPPRDAVTASVTKLLDDKDKLARLLPWSLKVSAARRVFRSPKRAPPSSSRQSARTSVAR